jgi:adenylate cyclase
MTETVAEQQEQLRQLQMLVSLSRRVAALDSLDAVLETLLQSAIEETGADRGSIFLHDADSGELLHVRRHRPRPRDRVG